MGSLISTFIPYILGLSILTSVHNGPGDPSDKGTSSLSERMYMLTYDHGGLILWGTDHFEERLDNAIEWLNKYPGFKIGLDNEAYVYDYLNAHQPALLDKIRNYLRDYEGRFGIGSCTYGQPLSTFIGGESNIRQIGYALEANRKYFNYRNPIYLMSEHAMHAQMPQILQGFGFEGAIMRTHFMMYGYNPTYNAPFGWWIGMDGSRIPTVPTYEGEGAAFGRTPVDNWILTRYPSSDSQFSLKDFRKQFKHINPLLATRADDSDLRKEELVREYHGNRNFQWILLDELLDLYPAPIAEFITKPEDFTVRMPWGYCGNEIWNQSRKAETQLLSTERLAAIGYLVNGKSFENSLDESWKHLLLAQHHDIQIVGLLPDARNHLGNSLNESGKVQEQLLKDLSQSVKSDGVQQVIVFNPLSWAGRQWVHTKVRFKRGEAKDAAVFNGNQKVASVIVYADRYSSGHIMECEVAFLAEIENLGLKVYQITAIEDILPPQPEKLKVDYDHLTISTPDYDIRLSEKGGIYTLFDKKTGQDLLETGRPNASLAGLIDGNACESSGKWIISKVSPGVPWVNATEYGFIADIPYEIQLKFDAGSPLIDCKIIVQLDSQRIGRLSDNKRESASPFIHEEKLRFRLFPKLSPSATGVRDLPFAIAKTDSKYIQGNYWTAVQDDRKGMAIFNKGNMCLVREADGGISIPLAYAMYYIWGTRMLQGEFRYEFALMPFSGGYNSSGIHKKALSYSFPFIYASSAPGNGKFGKELAVLDIKSENVLLSALYVDGGKVIARMFNCLDVESESGFTNLYDNSVFIETDLMGRRIGNVGDRIRFRPWQFRTFELDR